MLNYPAWRFGPDATSVVVLSPEEDQKLNDDWSDEPHDDFDPKTAPTYSSVAFVPVPVDVEAIAEEVTKRRGRPRKVVEVVTPDPEGV